MQATITYSLTEQAQRAQMAATGQPVARRQTVTVEIAAEDLDMFAVDGDGHAILDAKILTSTIDPLGQVRARIAAEKEAARVEREAKAVKQAAAMERYLSDPIRYKITHDQNSASWIDAIDVSAAEGPLAERYRAEFRRRMDAYLAERAARDEQGRLIAAEKAAKDAAAEQIKQDYISAWIAGQPDAELRAQFEDGLACRKAVVHLIAKEAFDQAGVPPRVIVPDTCSDNDCPCCDRSVDCLPRDAYAAWRKIKAIVPDGSTVTFARVRECLRGEGWDGEGDGAGKPYYTAEITMPCGPFQFVRRIQLEA